MKNQRCLSPANVGGEIKKQTERGTRIPIIVIIISPVYVGKLAHWLLILAPKNDNKFAHMKHNTY